MIKLENSRAVETGAVMGNERKEMLFKVLLNFFIYLFTYLIFYYFRYPGLKNFFTQLDVVSVYIGSWAIAAVISRKFRKKTPGLFIDFAYPHLISFFMMAGFLSLFILKFDLLSVPRFVLIGAFISSFFIELVILLIGTVGLKFSFNKPRRVILSYRQLIFDFLILFWVFYLVLLRDLNFGTLSPNFYLFITSVPVCWLITGIFSHQFNHGFFVKLYWHYIWGYIRGYIILGAILMFLMFILSIKPVYHSGIILSVIIYSLWSLITMTIFFINNKPPKTDETVSKLLYISTIEEIQNEVSVDAETKYKFKLEQPQFSFLREKLKNIYLKSQPAVFGFLDETIDLDSLNLTNSVMIRSRDIYNVEVLPDTCLEFFMNLHEVNDIRRINQYFIEVNRVLLQDGIFLGKFEPIKLRYKRFLKNYPFYLGRLFYFIDFCWRRVTPKLPFIKKIYFTLTQGKRRALSMAEGIGRLYFCGFEIIASREIDDYIFFVARKVKEPLKDKNPSYGLLFKMKRIGKNGTSIFVYKMRTMHPYSEYLQKFVYERNRLQEGGKIKNDFRITTWGKILRKLWIDELPMIINMVKGELKLVGVRPLSGHYLSLYDPQHRERRLKYKPGLVPPFYLDMPKSLDEIIASEKKYLDAYDKHPFLTDVRYFFGAFYNIIFKKARSA